MASPTEILDALGDYAIRCNNNPKLRRMLQGWSRVVHFRALDTDDAFTVRIIDGEIAGFEGGAVGAADLAVAATSEDLCDLFWGDLNPAQKYLNGEIVIRGAAADVLRIDAMASLIWAD
jgi:hypothetical protein